jgi:alpha/beta superfamily hydrolase
MARTIKFLLLNGPAGELEALLEEPEEGPPTQAALVAHPHPLYGGTMHSKVVHRLARGFRRAGAVVLRFNFRGVGRSQGVHDGGGGEVEDARACLEWLRSRYPGLPYTLAGFSFGSGVVLRLGCESMTASRVVAAGFPTRMGGAPGWLLGCTVPRVFIQSTHDQFGPREEFQPFFDALPEPKRLIWVEARDHFFAGGLEELEEAALRCVEDAGR